MELPGRTLGNPDPGLWDADVAHYVQSLWRGEGAVVKKKTKQNKKTQKGVWLTKRNIAL